MEAKQKELEKILQSSTTNSNGVSSGSRSLGSLSNNCMGSNWYAKNRCGAYLSKKKQLDSEIELSQKCRASKDQLVLIENQLDNLPPSDNLALFALISKISTFSINGLIFLIFGCLAVLLEISIIFQTFSYYEKETISSLSLLIVLALVSIRLNAIFWWSLGASTSTGFQIFSTIVGIILDVLKINFMFEV